MSRDNLRSQVIGGTAKSPCSVRNILGETKIGHSEVALLVNHQVLRLEITVDDVATVQILEDGDNLGGVELEEGRD